MKRKLIALGVCVALVLCMLPVTALAAPAYNDHDYNALKTFLNLTSANGVDTNGVTACGPGYSDADPSTWSGVTWVDVDGELHVQEISWQDSYLNGSLNLSGCTSLEYLDVSSFMGVTDNSIDGINVSGCTALGSIYCYNNPLAALDLTNLTALEAVGCARCENLTALTLTGCGNLTVLDCDYCPIGSLAFGTDFPNLEVLYCEDCELTSLDLSGCPAMRIIWCEYNDLTSINVTGLSNLVDLILGDSPNLASLDISDLTSLVQLCCWNCNVSSLELPSTTLEYLSCSENSISELDVSGQTMLEFLYCDYNNLTELDVSDCAALWSFGCGENQLTTLDVSHNLLLAELYCGRNQLTELDVSANPALYNLYCGENQLASLDVSHNPLLEELDCGANALTSLDTTACPALEMLWCADNPMTSIDTILEGQSIKLTANGSGYVGLTYDWWEDEYYIVAAEDAGAFMDWTNAADEQVSTMVQTDILPATAYELTANFLSLTSSDEDGIIYTGGRITLTPNFDGGEWYWDADYFSATFNSPATFTGLQAGTSTVEYTLDGVTVYYDVTIEESQLPNTGQDYTWAWVLGGGALILIAAGLLVLRRRKSVNNE